MREVGAATGAREVQPRSQIDQPDHLIEVVAGVTPANDAITRMLLDEFVVLSITDDIAERSAAIRRERRTKLPDAIIWATAEVHDRMLVTRNTRDFPLDEPGIRIPYVL